MIRRFLRRPAPAPSTRAEVEARRLIRARQLGRDAFDGAVADLRFRCRLAGDDELLGAALAALHGLDNLAAREARTLIEDADRGAAA